MQIFLVQGSEDGNKTCIDQDTLGKFTKCWSEQKEMDAKRTSNNSRQYTFYPSGSLLTSAASTKSSRSNQLVSSLSFPNIRRGLTRCTEGTFWGVVFTKGGFQYSLPWNKSFFIQIIDNQNTPSKTNLGKSFLQCLTNCRVDKFCNLDCFL